MTPESPTSPKKHDDETVALQNAVQKENPKVGSTPPIPPEIASLVRANDQPCKCQYEKTPWYVRVLELIALLAGISYAIVTWCMWRDSNHNFTVDERAWMAFKFVGGDITFTIDKPLLVPTELINVGKTPAKNVHGNIVVGVFKKGEALDFSYTSGHASYKVMAGTIFPSGKIVESFEAIKHGQEHAEPIIFTAPVKDELFSGQSFLIVHGRIAYSDVFGTEHWTTYCRYVLHPELISEQCTRYNDTDDNK